MDQSALEEIRRLKYRYARTLDLKLWDEFGQTLTADATADYGTHVTEEPIRPVGRDAIVEFMRNALGGPIITVHACTQPEIDGDGDEAGGIWLLEDTVISPEHQVLIKGSAYYEDRYRREDGVWRISHTSYVRTWEASMALTDVPSFTMLANRWADPAEVGA